jgi:capsular polysaccharide biosynthesis protein
MVVTKGYSNNAISTAIIQMHLRLQPNTALIYPVAATPFVKTLQVRPLAPNHYRRPPISLLDPAATGFGRHVAKPRSIRRAPLLAHRVYSARQTGFRLITDPDGCIVLDDVLTDAAACQAQLRRFSTQDNAFLSEDTDVREEAGRYFSDRLDSPSIKVPGTTFSLLSAEPSNYGSFLFRIIAKLAIAHTMDLSDVRIACWCPRPFQQSLLAFFGVTGAQMFDVRFRECYEFEDLYVPSSPNPEAFLNEMTLDFVGAALKRNGITRSRSRCVYISRIGHAQRHQWKNVRHFVAEERLSKRLSAAGFEIVEPEQLGVVDQIALFANAAVVVGASGAGMFNTIFCEAGTLVYDIEAFPHWLHAHANYFASCGHNYAMAFGKPDETDLSGPHRRWTIDPDAVADHVLRLRDALG